MSTLAESSADVRDRVAAHLCDRIRAATVWAEPFGHAYFEDVFPADVYAVLTSSLPPARCYLTGPRDPRVPDVVRTFYHLDAGGIRRFPPAVRNVWAGVAAALTDAGVKRCLFALLAADLSQRFGVPEEKVPDLPAFPRPTLYRDVEGFSLPPHPDTLKKVVTMHLYLPTDASRLDLGTTVYRRESRGEFTPVRRFAFRPNSGYAFAVSDGPGRQSWHGRESLPAGCGVRDTLLNTYYGDPREGYSGYAGDVAPPHGSGTSLNENA